MTDVLRKPLTDIVDLVASREISAVELMKETLRRIEETQDTLRAFCQVGDPDVLLAEAAHADDRLARQQGRPLEGIPLGVKELEDALGFRSTNASIPFRDDFAEQDSAQVDRLKNAGAIVVGKTNAPEFGHTAITKNLLYGVSHNPWGLDWTPGGSSGGSSAAIAGGVLALATASDGGGSIRIPASSARNCSSFSCCSSGEGGSATNRSSAARR